MEEQHQLTGCAHYWNSHVFIVRSLERDHASRLGGKHSPKHIGLQRLPLGFVFLDGSIGVSLFAMEYIDWNLAQKGEGRVHDEIAGQAERPQASVPNVAGWLRVDCVSSLDQVDS